MAAEASEELEKLNREPPQFVAPDFFDSRF